VIRRSIIIIPCSLLFLLFNLTIFTSGLRALNSASFQLLQFYSKAQFTATQERTGIGNKRKHWNWTKPGSSTERGTKIQCTTILIQIHQWDADDGNQMKRHIKPINANCSPNKHRHKKTFSRSDLFPRQASSLEDSNRYSVRRR